MTVATIVRTTILVLLLPPWGSTIVHGGQTVTSAYFRRILYHTGMTFTVQQPASSLSKCAVHCLGSSVCRSLCYSVLTSVCYTYNGSSLTTQPVEDSGNDLPCITSRECPGVQGYSMHGGLCVKLYTDPMPYMNATYTCETDGAHLVHYKSEAHKTALQDLYHAEDAVDVWWWVGADDLDTEGTFVWRSDGTQLPTSDPLWRSGEPSNQGLSEHCVHLYTSNFKLNDLPCACPCSFVCQIDLW